MRILDPFFISSRLLPALRVGDAVLHLEQTTWDDAGETAHFILEIPGLGEYWDRQLHCEAGFWSRVGIFADFLGFLEYAVEEGEGNEMFPPWVRAWAVEHLEDIRDAWDRLHIDGDVISDLIRDD